MFYISTSDLETHIYEAQHKIIAEKYGEQAAELANYGWAVEEYDDRVGVCTKVYVEPVMLLDTEGTTSGEMVHVWSER